MPLHCTAMHEGQSSDQGELQHVASTHKAHGNGVRGALERGEGVSFPALVGSQRAGRCANSVYIFA